MKKWIFLSIIAIGLLFELNTAKAEEMVNDYFEFGDTQELKEYVNTVKLKGYDIVTMYSTDESVATVDEDGNVVGVGIGNAQIRVVCDEALEGYKESVCDVEVSATKVTLDPNGGAINSSVYEVLYNTVYGKIPEPVRKGYEFNGWYKENGELVSEDTIVTDPSNHTLIAKWTELSYREPVVKIDENNYDVLLVVKGYVNIPEIGRQKGNRDRWSVVYTNKGIVNVASNGKISGVKPGETVATVNYGTKSYTIKIKVESPQFKEKKFFVNTDSTIDVSLVNTDLKATYSSSNQKIFDVSADGIVSGKKYGVANVTAVVCGRRFSVSVNVDEPALKTTNVEILNNIPYTMALTKTRSKNIIWLSDDENVVTISSRGKITPVATGHTNIHAIVNNKDLVCRVKVDKPVISASTCTIKKGETYEIKLNQTEYNPVWTSSNKNVATVNEQGNITGIKKGRATISTKINRVTYRCVVVVTD